MTVQLSPKGVGIIPEEAKPGLAFDSPASAIGSLDLAFQTGQLMSKQAIEQLTAGNPEAATRTLLEAIQYAGLQRGRIQLYEESQTQITEGTN